MSLASSGCNTAAELLSQFLKGNLLQTVILSKFLKQKTFIFLLVLHVCGVHACMDTYMFCVVEACGGQDVSSTLHPLYQGGVSHLNAELARTTSLASQLAFGSLLSAS